MVVFVFRDRFECEPAATQSQRLGTRLQRNYHLVNLLMMTNTTPTIDIRSTFLTISATRWSSIDIPKTILQAELSDCMVGYGEVYVYSGGPSPDEAVWTP